MRQFNTFFSGAARNLTFTNGYRWYSACYVHLIHFMGKTKQRIGIVTVTTRNYFHRTRVLMDSFKRLVPGLDRMVYCVDDLTGLLDKGQEDFTIVQCDQLEIPSFGKLKLALNPTALCCVMKPHIVLHAMRELGAESVLYIDNDIGIYREPIELINAARTYPFVLCPHFLGPMPAGSVPNEFSLKPYGIYNAGIFAARNTSAATDFLEWWAKWMEQPKHVIEGWGYDQTWLDYMPVFCEGVYILRNAGYNVAFWNLAERQLKMEDEKVVCNSGAPLTAFHFSSLDEGCPEALVRHARSCNQPHSEATRKLGRDIAEAWASAGRSTCLSWGYQFAVWPDGKPVVESERKWLVSNWDSVANIDFFTKSWSDLEPSNLASFERARWRGKLTKLLLFRVARKFIKALSRVATGR